MRTMRLTGAETGPELVKQLVLLRAMGRHLAKTGKEAGAAQAEWERIQKECPTETGAASLLHVKEVLFETHFMEIELGRYLFGLCKELDQKAAREQVFDALNTNLADRDTDLVRKHGARTISLISVLDLENSASCRGDDFIDPMKQPLRWCHNMFFVHSMNTNTQLDKAIHERANEFFDGAFGEYRARPVLERLIGRPV